MGKRIIGIEIIVVLTFCVLSFSYTEATSIVDQHKQGHDEHHSQSGDNWNEMEEYHDVMSQTFHPAEEGNLEPVRKRAVELAAKAKQWLDSKPPKIYDKKEIRDLLFKLESESKALADNIAKGMSDDQVKKELTALHDRFHEIMGACKVERKKHH